MTAVQASTGPAPTASVPPAAAPAAGRLRALDGLRLLAALAVCGYHYGGRGGDITRAWGASPGTLFPTVSGLLSYGPLGVQLFFVISGFVISMSGWGRPPKAFAASRAARLLPAYWAAIVLVTAVFALPRVPFGPVSPSDLLTNLTMLQMPLGDKRVLGVDWTLWVEVRFYLLFAVFVVWRGATRRRVLLFSLFWTVGAVLADASHDQLLNLVLMPQYAPFFIGGIGLYLVYRFGNDAAAWSLVAVGWLLGQHYAVRELVAPAHTAAFHHRTQLAVITLVTLAFVAVAGVTLTPLARVDWRLLTTAGALTYPFYLVHEHLGWAAIDLLHRQLRLPAPAVLVLTAGAMLALAWLLHLAVERPLGPRIKRALVAAGGGPGPLRARPGRDDQKASVGT